MRDRRAPLAPLLAIMLAACATSPPVMFYTLEPVHSGASRTEHEGAPVQVAAVHLPRALDRREMVRQSAPNRMTISSENRWGAPLTEVTREVLTQNLSARLAPNRMVFPETPPPPGTLGIVLDVARFARDTSGVVIFDGSWSLYPSGSDQRMAHEEFKLTEVTASGDYAEQARAMSTVLGRLADQIARAIP